MLWIQTVERFYAEDTHWDISRQGIQLIRRADGTCSAYATMDQLHLTLKYKTARSQGTKRCSSTLVTRTSRGPLGHTLKTNQWKRTFQFGFHINHWLSCSFINKHVFWRKNYKFFVLYFLICLLLLIFHHHSKDVIFSTWILPDMNSN